MEVASGVVSLTLDVFDSTVRSEFEIPLKASQGLTWGSLQVHHWAG
jgi:hypothetical protein